MTRAEVPRPVDRGAVRGRRSALPVTVRQGRQGRHGRRAGQGRPGGAAAAEGRPRTATLGAARRGRQPGNRGGAPKAAAGPGQSADLPHFPDMTRAEVPRAVDRGAVRGRRSALPVTARQGRQGRHGRRAGQGRPGGAAAAEGRPRTATLGAARRGRQPGNRGGAPKAAAGPGRSADLPHFPDMARAEVPRAVDRGAVRGRPSVLPCQPGLPRPPLPQPCLCPAGQPRLPCQPEFVV